MSQKNRYKYWSRVLPLLLALPRHKQKYFCKTGPHLQKRVLAYCFYVFTCTNMNKRDLQLLFFLKLFTFLYVYSILRKRNTICIR